MHYDVNCVVCSRILTPEIYLQIELGRDGLDKARDSLSAMLLLAQDNSVLGCCLAEQIGTAHRLIVSDRGRPKAWEVAEAEEKALVGIYRLWVASNYRGQGLGTALVDCARRHLIYGLSVPRNEIAFSDPTGQGRDFASKYFGRDDFLVYIMPKQ